MARDSRNTRSPLNWSLLRSGWAWILAALLLWFTLLGMSRAADPPAVEVTASEVIVSTPVYQVQLSLRHRMPRVMTYTVFAEQVEGAVTESRDWWSPAQVDPDWILESEDYEQSAYDRGHLRALSLTRTAESHYVNALCAIVPQHYVLNRGAWKSWEGHVAELARRQGLARITIVSEFHSDNQLPRADEPHRIPSSFLVTVISGGDLLRWRFPNDATASGSHIRFLITDPQP